MVNYVPRALRFSVPLLYTCFLRALRTFFFLSDSPAFIFLCTLRALCALFSYVSYGPSFFYMSCMHSYQCALRASIILRAFIFYVPYVSSFITCLHFIHLYTNKSHTN